MPNPKGKTPDAVLQSQEAYPVDGWQIRKLRGTNIKQATLAAHARMSQGELSKIERGVRQTLKGATIELLADGLGVEPVLLVTLPPAPPTDSAPMKQVLEVPTQRPERAPTKSQRSDASTLLRLCKGDHFVVTLVGPPGSGKTTVLRTLIAESPQDVSILIDVDRHSTHKEIWASITDQVSKWIPRVKPNRPRVVKWLRTHGARIVIDFPPEHRSLRGDLEYLCSVVRGVPLVIGACHAIGLKDERTHPVSPPAPVSLGRPTRREILASDRWAIVSASLTPERRSELLNYPVWSQLAKLLDMLPANAAALAWFGRRLQESEPKDIINDLLRITAPRSDGDSVSVAFRDQLARFQSMSNHSMQKLYLRLPTVFTRSSICRMYNIDRKDVDMLVGAGVVCGLLEDRGETVKTLWRAQELAHREGVFAVRVNAKSWAWFVRNCIQKICRDETSKIECILRLSVVASCLVRDCANDDLMVGKVVQLFLHRTFLGCSETREWWHMLLLASALREAIPDTDWQVSTVARYAATAALYQGQPDEAERWAAICKRTAFTIAQQCSALNVLASIPLFVTPATERRAARSRLMFEQAAQLYEERADKVSVDTMRMNIAHCYEIEGCIDDARRIFLDRSATDNPLLDALFAINRLRVYSYGMERSDIRDTLSYLIGVDPLVLGALSGSLYVMLAVVSLAIETAGLRPGWYRRAKRSGGAGGLSETVALAAQAELCFLVDGMQPDFLESACLRHILKGGIIPVADTEMLDPVQALRGLLSRLSA